MKKIKLTQGKFAIVDNEDYEWLNQWKWCYNSDGYTARGQWDPVTKKIITILMHRLIMNAKKGEEVDHANHNTLDNRKCNLRICTKFQNMQNSKLQKNRSSKYKGVCWHKDNKKWKAYITYEGKRIHLGYYDIEEEAARVYDKKAIELFGKFAYLNFPQRKSR